MYDNENSKKNLNISFDNHTIILSDGEGFHKIIETQSQLFDVLSNQHYNFSDSQIQYMKSHIGISIDTIIDQIIDKELEFQTSRSGGKGGQNVNKVETKIQLFFNIVESKFLDNTEKEKIIGKAHQKQLHKDKTIISFECQETRLQEKNKEIAIHKFKIFVKEALKDEIERQETEIPEHSINQRKSDNKHHSKKKKHRQQNNFEQ